MPKKYAKVTINYLNKAAKTYHKPSKLLKKVSFDLIKPLLTELGRTNFILAVLDTFSKSIKLYAPKNATI